MKRFDSGLDDSPGFDDNPDLNDSVNLSEIVGYGGGVGFLTGRGQKVIEAELYMIKSEKDEDLGFTIGFSPGFKLPFLPFQSKATTFTMRGLNKGLNRDNIYYGFEISLSTS